MPVCVVVKDGHAAYCVIYRHNLAGRAAAHTAAEAVCSVLLEHRVHDLQRIILRQEDTAAAPVVHGIGAVVGDIAAGDQGGLLTGLDADAAAFGCLGHIGRHGAAGHDELRSGITNAAAGFSAVIAGDVAIVGNGQRFVVERNTAAEVAAIAHGVTFVVQTVVGDIAAGDRRFRIVYLCAAATAIGAIGAVICIIRHLISGNHSSCHGEGTVVLINTASFVRPVRRDHAAADVQCTGTVHMDSTADDSIAIICAAAEVTAADIHAAVVISSNCTLPIGIRKPSALDIQNGVVGYIYQMIRGRIAFNCAHICQIYRMLNQRFCGSAVSVVSGFRNIVNKYLRAAVVACQVTIERPVCHNFRGFDCLPTIGNGQRTGAVQINHRACTLILRHIVVDRVAVQAQRGRITIANICRTAIYMVYRNVAAQVIAAAGSQLGELLCRVNGIGVVQRFAGGVEADDVAVALGGQADAAVVGNNILLAVLLNQFPAICFPALVQFNDRSVALFICGYIDICTAFFLGIKRNGSVVIVSDSPPAGLIQRAVKPQARPVIRGAAMQIHMQAAVGKRAYEIVVIYYAPDTESLRSCLVCCPELKVGFLLNISAWDIQRIVRCRAVLCVVNEINVIIAAL